MRTFRHLWVLLALLSFAMTFATDASTQGNPTFTNPLLTSGADPQVTTFEGSYYLTYTNGSDIRVRKADSLKNVRTSEEHVIWTDVEAERCCNVWAPELHRLRGPDGWRWYVYYTAGPSECCAEQRMHVLESETDDPLGPYVHKAKLFDKEHDFWAIDPTVFQTSDETAYVAWSGTPQDHMQYEKPQYLYIAKLTNPWTLATSRVEISRPEYAWEQVDGEVNEGPAVLKHEGRLFLTFSGSGCWTDDYAVGMLTADEGDDLLEPGSWTKATEPLLSRDDEAQAFGPGHNNFFKSPDGSEDWIIYHANPAAGLGCDDARSPRVQKVTWGEGGLPVFGKPVALDTPTPLPAGDAGR